MRRPIARLALVFASSLLVGTLGYGAVLHVNTKTPLLTTPAGNSVLVDAVITNSTAEVVFISGVSTAIGEEFATENLFDEFNAARPNSLSPGESWEGPVLRLTLAPDAPIETTVITVSFVGGDHESDIQELATLTFALNDSRVGVPGDIGSGGFGPLRAWPNPVHGSAEIAFELASPGEVDVQVHDVRGASVRTLAHGFKSAGRQSVVWDGRNRKGDRVHPGVYFLKLETQAGTRKTKVVRID